jgi:hypothetical protein
VLHGALDKAKGVTKVKEGVYETATHHITTETSNGYAGLNYSKKTSAKEE